MIRDLNYVGGGPHPSLRLTTDDTTPEILKKAITLLLFSRDDKLRNFNGESVVGAFGQLTNAGFDGISFYLTVAAKRLYTILSAEYPEISSIYFAAEGEDSTLRITLNVKLADNDIESMVVYE